ncbi:hypothetical protein CRYUN_Cryun01aG0041900 [Craigia yunnanensis]
MDPKVEKEQEDEGSDWGKSLPVPSVQELRKGDEDERRKLDLGCKDWGFFQIINHGVAEEVLLKMKAIMSAFFELAPEEKKQYAQAENDFQGYGQVYVVSEEQKVDWCDMVLLITLPPEIRNLKYWPDTIPGFKDGLKRFHGKTKQAVRMNYYPPCSRPDLVLGISPHSDSDLITLLLQDDEIPGLQIRHNDEWFLFLSNGMYKSIEHRAITNEKKTRISLATVMFPYDELEIGPLESMVDDHRLRMYRKIKYIDYLRFTFERKWREKLTLTF